MFKNFPQFVDSQSQRFCIVNEAKVDVFLEFSCFLYYPTNVDNLISGSFASLKPSMCIWKFLVHKLLKPSLKDFEHNLASIWNKHSCTAVCTFFSIALLWNYSERWSFPSCGHCSVFWIHWHIECNTSAREIVTYCPLTLLSCPLWQLFYWAYAEFLRMEVSESSGGGTRTPATLF